MSKTLAEWGKEINQWAEEKGWNKDLNSTPDSIGKQLTNFHSEISEAWEEVKNGKGIREVWFSGSSLEAKPEGFPVELADLMIRVMHTAEFYGIDLEQMMELKQAYNRQRSYRHGGKKA